MSLYTISNRSKKPKLTLNIHNTWLNLRSRQGSPPKFTSGYICTFKEHVQNSFPTIYLLFYTNYSLTKYHFKSS